MIRSHHTTYTFLQDKDNKILIKMFEEELLLTRQLTPYVGTILHSIVE